MILSLGHFQKENRPNVISIAISPKVLGVSAVIFGKGLVAVLSKYWSINANMRPIGPSMLPCILAGENTERYIDESTGAMYDFAWRPFSFVAQMASEVCRILNFEILEGVLERLQNFNFLAKKFVTFVWVYTKTHGSGIMEPSGEYLKAGPDACVKRKLYVDLLSSC